MKKSINRKKWLLITIAITFFIVLCLSTSVRADGFELKLETDKYEVKANETIEIKIITENDKIYSLYSRINFDDTRFVYTNLVSDKNFDAIYNSANKSFTIESSTSDYEYPENGIIATFTFKALSDTNVEGIFLEEPEIDGFEDFYEYTTNVEIEYPKNPIYLKSQAYKIGENNSHEYVTGDEYLYRVSPNTTLTDFIANLETNGNISIYNADGEEETNLDELVKTGMTIKVSKEGSTDINLTVIVIGDVNGDGIVDITDLVKVRQQIQQLFDIDEKVTKFDEKQNKAGDINEDLFIDITDLVKIRRHIQEIEIL